jgi:hypothetical protein
MDLDLMLSASAALTRVLPDFLGVLPFAPADQHELWLLDGAGEPLALLASTTQAPFGERIRAEPWAATARSDHRFRSARLLERGVPVREGHDPRHHAVLLERLVRDTAGRPARMAWFNRDPEGGGQAALRGPWEREGGPPRLPAESFPALLLREEWPEVADRELVSDFLDWSAPYLLTLPGLSDAQRNRFENAARARPMDVDALFRLYPKVLNPGLLKAIRVEARMRRTATA